MLALTTGLVAQNTRPVPYPVFTSPQFERAVERGTRTPSGEPGPNYWTNTASYSLQARLDTTNHVLAGEAQIRYRNASPDALRQLHLHLYQNVYGPGAVRNRFTDLTGGLRLTGLSVNGVDYARRTGENGVAASVLGTLLVLLDEPLMPGDSVSVGASWFNLVPEESFRNEHDDEIYFITHWYPEMAVYDDLHGWDTDQYFGLGEFYMGYADYDVGITVPEGMLVAATGTLINPDEVLSEQSRTPRDGLRRRRNDRQRHHGRRAAGRPLHRHIRNGRAHLALRRLQGAGLRVRVVRPVHGGG